ncbi:MAG: ribosome small subunit-dependent GTPase A [Planctomycetota bacterium]|nr:ribosome small subunit-dependent GTPase A [Planctomycetota bacterium]
MPRRKGKSRRRIKDWQQRFRDADADSLDADSAETLQPLRVKLPPNRPGTNLDETSVEQSPPGEETIAMVTGLFPGGAVVRIGAEDLLCRLAGTFRPPKGSSALAVGDDVAVALTHERHISGEKEIDRQRTDGVILYRRPRRSALSRPQPTSGKRRRQYDDDAFEKVIAANMDTLLIIASVRQPKIRPALIDRFCIVAERGEMKPVVVINKIDLGNPDKHLLAELKAGGLEVFLCSATTGKGLRKLLKALQGRRSILAGASGVGKSALVNALVPGADQAVRQIRMKDQRGRHVTSAATLHELPGGGLLVDTPGVRELAVEMEAAELTWYFPELAELAPKCKFNNCTHTHEPDCAVIAAVEDGKINTRRYQSYLRILGAITVK